MTSQSVLPIKQENKARDHFLLGKEKDLLNSCEYSIWISEKNQFYFTYILSWSWQAYLRKKYRKIIEIFPVLKRYLFTSFLARKISLYAREISLKQKQIFKLKRYLFKLKRHLSYWRIYISIRDISLS
jgi:phosphoenolpyruvate synthase/pyruvate phosphate dikinase